MNTHPTCDKPKLGTRALAAVWRCRRSFRPVAAWVLMGIMLFNFLGEGCQLFQVVLAQHDISPTSLIASIFPRETEPAPKSCCAGNADTQTKSCSCPDCGDNCPMGAACTCDADGHRSHRSEGLFFTVPGCHPEDGNGAHYLPLSMRVAFVLEAPSNPVDTARTIDSVFPKPERLVSYSLKPPVPPPRIVTA